MTTSVILEDLVAALEWVSAGESAAMDSAAYVSKATGKVHWSGEGIDEELPPNIEDATLYVAVPGKSELGLGRSLALLFAQDHLPDQTETVHQIFAKRGAYSRFKSLLERAGLVEAWHAYEARAIEDALVEWGAEHGFNCIRKPDDRGV